MPTFAEEGFPELTTEEWYGFHAPSRTPAPDIAKASMAINAALKDSVVVDSLALMGLQARGSTPAEMARSHREELMRWGADHQEGRFPGPVSRSSKVAIESRELNANRKSGDSISTDVEWYCSFTLSTGEIADFYSGQLWVAAFGLVVVAINLALFIG